MNSLENSFHRKTKSDEEEHGEQPPPKEDEPSLYDKQAVVEVEEEKSIYDSEPATTTEPVTTHTEQEVSIYEIQTVESDSNNKSLAEKLELYENYTYSSEDKKLCFLGNDVEDLPTELIYLFGLKALILDISFNNLTDLKDLSQFPYLEELICDNNLVSENSNYPNLPKLKLLSCNKNKIKDIHIFIDKVKKFFPKLTYLSLLGNDACPNQLIDENKDEYDYSRYRKYVIYRLPSLKFLDSNEVTTLEREEAKKESLFYDVVSYKEKEEEEEEEGGGKSNQNDNAHNSSSLYTPLADTSNGDQNGNHDPKASFGVCRYVYYGKQSEGNRFIKNDDL